MVRSSTYLSVLMADLIVPDPTFFPGHAASIHVHLNGREHVIGAFGILHPEVLEKFELRYPVTTLEMNIEVFL
jgi:phenylalanyl-tRNA synthetase beta chain